MDDQHDESRNSGVLWLLVFVLAVILSIVSKLIFDKVDDADQRIEWFKTLGTLGTPIAVIVGLWFTNQTLKVNRGSLDQTRKAVQNASLQLELEGRSRADEMFHKAVSLLDSSATETGKVAALAILENISLQRDELYRACIDVICGFLRAESADMPDLREAEEQQYMSESMFTAWSILARRRGHFGDNLEGSFPLNLQDVKCFSFESNRMDFCGARFRRAQFVGCRFGLSRFAHAEFFGAVMQDVVFGDCDLSWAEFNSDSIYKYSHVVFSDVIRRLPNGRCIVEIDELSGVYTARREPQPNPNVLALTEGVSRAPHSLNHQLAVLRADELILGQEQKESSASVDSQSGGDSWR